LIDDLRHLFDPGGIIIGIDGNQLLRQLVEDIKVLLILVQFRVEGLLRESEMKVNTRNVKFEGPSPSAPSAGPPGCPLWWQWFPFARSSAPCGPATSRAPSAWPRTCG